jgi:hypothetical protein
VAHFTIDQAQTRGKTIIIIRATPQSPETRALLREFKAGVSQLEKKWNAIIKARKKRKE